LTGFALENGNIGGVNYHVDYQGRGPNPERQETPHAHQVKRSPYAPFLYVCDLGTDTIWMHSLGPESGQTGKPDTALVVPPGYGPRHLACDPILPAAYILCELVPKILVAEIDTKNSLMKVVQELDTVGADKTDITAPAAVKLHPSGRTLAVSNRFDDTIAVFSIHREGQENTRPPADESVPTNATTPSLRLIERFPCGGKTPRDIEFSPDGEILFMANQDSHSLTSRYFDAESGLPTADSGPTIQTGAPVCVVALSR
jgi:6-phosphogluconolactonase